jgi:hypothetical protein
MKHVLDLQLGYTDAENYRRPENKEMFNRVFIRNEHLDSLCQHDISFLIGEKGTGKTAYAVFLANNDYKATRGSTRFIRETEYQKFITLKREKHLDLSDYTSIWKVIIYLLLSQQVKDLEGGVAFLQKFTKMAAIQSAIDEYYHKAFSPEIIQALQFVQESSLSAGLISKHANLGASEKDSFTASESRFQSNLFFIQRSFESALKQIRLSSNHILFIDGIDIRPATIPYQEYLECIRGLANAVWEVNNDVFPSAKKSKFRMRVVLLIRPDIFPSLGLQNLNTKSRDNSVFLDWRTEYTSSRSSELFRVVDHLLAYQQTETMDEGLAWDHYFPWNAPSSKAEYRSQSSFVSFLRFSYYRPRDIITMLVILQDIAREAGSDVCSFSYEDFNNPTFRRRYADYLLGELKDQLIFYYSNDEYESFLKFFEFLDGRYKFDHGVYLSAYEKFQKHTSTAASSQPRFMTSPSAFLQFLYDLNVICYIEYPENDIPYFRWCFRERSYANISPKVKEGVTYEVFYGLGKALNLGQGFTSRMPRVRRRK